MDRKRGEWVSWPQGAEKKSKTWPGILDAAVVRGCIASSHSYADILNSVKSLVSPILSYGYEPKTSGPRHSRGTVLVTLGTDGCLKPREGPWKKPTPSPLTVVVG